MEEKNNIRKFTSTNYTIDHYSISPNSNEIIGQFSKTKVRRKTIEVLSFLAANVGKAVSRDEILSKVWKNQPSTDAVLTQVISELRKIFFSKDGEEPIIETIPKFGYRLNAKVNMGEVQFSNPENQNSNHPIFKFLKNQTRQIHYLWASVILLAFSLVFMASTSSFQKDNENVFTLNSSKNPEFKWTAIEKVEEKDFKSSPE